MDEDINTMYYFCSWRKLNEVRMLLAKIMCDKRSAELLQPAARLRCVVPLKGKIRLRRLLKQALNRILGKSIIGKYLGYGGHNGWDHSIKTAVIYGK